MSPEDRHDFETVWPELSIRLKAFLTRKRIPLDQREDLVQETGARLVANWDKVDTARPTWPLAMTIALNLVRDRARRQMDVVADIPDLAEDYDLEAAGIARIELTRVRSALTHLSSRQREVILAEIGRETSSARSDKMTRSRARRKLNHLVGRASAGLSLQFRRLADFVHAAVGTDGALQGLGCSACALLAVTAVLVPHTAPARSSELSPFQRAFGELNGAGTNDVSDLALSAAAARTSAPDSAHTSTTLRARRALSGSKARPTAPSSAPAATEPTVPGTSDLPDLPGRGPSEDEVPVPKPPQGVRAVVERTVATAPTKIKVALSTL